MACTIKYKGIKFTEEEFKEYISNNSEEFSNLLSTGLADDVVSTKFVQPLKTEEVGVPSTIDNIVSGILPTISSEILIPIANKYEVEQGTPEFKDAVGRELIDSMFKRQNTELVGLAKDQLISAFSAMTKTERDSLQGFERKLYNIVTDQKTRFSTYPKLKPNEIAFPSETGEWEIYNRDKILEDSLSGKIDVSSIYGLSSVIANELVYNDKANSTNINYIDYSKIFSESDKSNTLKKLFRTLEKLGFSTVKLSDYITSFNLKHGMDPSVNAVADLVNRVVAIAEGGDTETLLSEEVAHILTETYNKQDEIRAILPEVEGTDMWVEHSARYFKLYEGKGLSGEQLTEKVRREILGKLIAEKISKQDVSTSLLDRISQIVNRFFSNIKSFLKPSIKSDLDALTSTIADSIQEEQKLDEMYSSANLNQNPYSEFFNATSESALTSQLNNLVRDSRKLLNKNKRGSITNKVDQLATLAANNALNTYQSLQAVEYYIDITNSVKRDVMTKIKKYDESVKAGVTPKSFLGSIDNTSISVLITENLPHLQTLKATIKGVEAPSSFSGAELRRFNNLKSKLSSQLDDMISDINSIKGEVNLKNSISGMSLLEEMINNYNINPEAAREIREYMKATHRDISTLQMFFGNLQHAPNPILALFGRMIGEVHHKTDVATKSYSMIFKNKLAKLGIKQSEFQNFFDKLIQKGPNNKITGYLKSVVDWSKFETARTANEIQAYNTANEIYINELNSTKGTNLVFTPITDLEQIGTEPNIPRATEFIGSAKEAYNKIIQDWREENLEQPYNKSFRQQRQDMITEIETNGVTLPDGTVVNEVPDVVLDMMSGWAAHRRDIKAPYIKNGVLDYSSMSEVERAELDSIKRARLEAKSLVDSITGEAKTDEDLKIALALQAIEQYYIQNNTTSSGPRQIKDTFLEKLSTFTDNNKAFEWFTQNAGISFNDNFWKALDTNSISSSEKFRNNIENASIADDVKDDLLLKVDELEKLLKKKNQFLKQFKNPTNPAEVDTYVMSPTAKNTFIGIERDIEDLYKELNTSLKTFTGATIQPNVVTESTANEAFERDFNDFKNENPLLGILDFAKNNTTISGMSSVSAFNNHLNRFDRSGEVTHLESFRIPARKMLGLPEGASAQEIATALEMYKVKNGSFENLLIDYTKTKLVGYYKRFAPKGFTNFYSMLKSGNIVDKNGNSYTLPEVITLIKDGNPNNVQFENDVVKYLSINSEVEWLNDESGMDKNPNFIENIEGISTNYGGYGQPKLSEFKNTEFINEYNIDLQLYTTTGETKSKGTSTEKQKELDFLEFLVHSRHNNLTDQGVSGVANSYALPGVRTGTADKAKNFFSNPVQTIREGYQDFIDNSIDKKIFGETASGEIDNDPADISRLVVPRLNVQPLERIEDTSTDLLYSYTVHAYNANLYKNREEAMTKANQLEALLLSRDFKDKSAANSNVHKTFQDFKKAYLLGVQETKRIKVGVGGKQFDLTNLLRTFDRALGTVNVGLNPAVSITAGTSALTFSATESLVGQYMNPTSYKKGVARFHSKAKSFVAESGDINKTNEVYVFGERFGLFNILNGVENSGESRFLREMFKDGVTGMAHVLTEVITKPFAPSIMYAMLDNHRFVTRTDANGNTLNELMTFEQFREAAGSTGKTADELNTLWKSYEDKSVLNNISVVDGQVKYSDFMENTLWAGMTEEEKETARTSIELKVKNMVSTVLSKVDAKMPMYDKSVASRNALARFLLRHREWFTINFQNRFKRGHNNLYTGQYEEGHYVTLSRVLYDMYKAFDIKDSQNLREVFDTLTPTEKMNLKRVMIDSAISAVLIAAGAFIVAPWNDDDENKDNWRVQFMAYMYYRLASEQMSSGLTGVPSYKDMLESPFVAVNSLKEIMKPSNWTTDEVESGSYEGHSKIFKLAAKNTFLRHYYDLSHGLPQKSDFYRLNNEWTLWGMQKTSQKEKEEKRKYEEELNDSFLNKSERFMR